MISDSLNQGIKNPKCRQDRAVFTFLKQNSEKHFVFFTIPY